MKDDIHHKFFGSLILNLKPKIIIKIKGVFIGSKNKSQE